MYEVFPEGRRVFKNFPCLNWYKFSNILEFSVKKNMNGFSFRYAQEYLCFIVVCTICITAMELTVLSIDYCRIRFWLKFIYKMEILVQEYVTKPFMFLSCWKWISISRILCLRKKNNKVIIWNTDITMESELN